MKQIQELLFSILMTASCTVVLILFVILKLIRGNNHDNPI